ncbi:MAG: type II secretion system F family protein [Gammaproteobacteria bacterium]|nr:type II secretion system F family protein [Gammaproteobacteria bacterium]MCW8983028.1 type II secretion system F family protein [Gammaproteobacteria bacterium]
MATFRYRARSQRGDTVTGTVEAATADAVAGQLLNSGVTPIEINETQPKTDFLADFKKQLNSSKPDIDELILFCRQMYTLTKAGVPIIRGLVGLADTTRNQVLKSTIEKMRQELESGRDLSSSMGQHPKIFSALMISMIRVGESTGQLDEAFLQLSQYLERDRDTRNQIKAALRYPAFVLIAISIAIVIVNIFVIPAFAGVFAGMKMDLPWQTQALIGTSDFFVAYWKYMLGALVALVLWVRYYINTDEGRYRWDKLKLRLPIAGSIIMRATLARFARTFAMTARSGVPLIQALSVVARAVDNDYVADKVLGIRTGIERGDSLTRTAVAANMFTPLVIQMLSVGEETGAVDDMLDEVATFYDREVDYDVKNISSAIEPILIISIGILVLILALGIFLPMWEMTSMASR